MQETNLQNLTFVHTNSEIKTWLDKLKPTIIMGCINAKLPSIDFRCVISNVAIKYATGKIKYDPTRGAKESTHLYRIAYNEACDYRRKFYDRSVGFEEGEKERIPDTVKFAPTSARLDVHFLVREALNRLARECVQESLEILVRSVILQEKREELAQIYGKQPDYISLVKTRYHQRLQHHFRAALREDRQGVLKPSANRIEFLKPFLPWI